MDDALRAILQLTLIPSCFDYINRVADALAFGRESRPLGRDPSPMRRG